MNQQPPQFDSYKEIVNPSPGLELAPHPTKPWSQAPYYTPAPTEHTICGVRRTTFLLSVALAVTIIAAAVGGGVGGSIAVQQAKSACISNSTSTSAPEANQAISTTTITATVTTTASPSSTTGPLVVPTGNVKLDCPGLNDDIAITLGDSSWIFTPTCDVDYHGNDFGAVVAYSLEDCLRACAAHNSFSGEDECTTITFRTNQTYYIPSNYGNCWLKSGDPQGILSNNPDEDPVAGASLKQRLDS
ncbi:hypothetical protein F5Y08DRAFT_303675 [Xylaria arbuscula]|nr:hypothetical protein F5Y08DRAFT_303675 [Xylaria arbuscula]